MCRQSGQESPPPEDGSERAGQDMGAENGDDEQSPLLEGVVFLALDSRADSVLWDARPVFIIMVDSDVAFVRQLEVSPQNISLLLRMQ